MSVSMSVSKFTHVYLPVIIKYDFNIIPVMVGNPGISKTEQLHQLCKKMNWGLVPVHLALRPIESLSGLPEITREDSIMYTDWSMPEIITQANRLAKKHEKVILFFDDIHLADKTRQSYFFELATERSLSGHKLADNVKIVCAGNPTAKAGAKTFLTAIINRFSFVNVHLDFKDWVNWALNKTQDKTIKIKKSQVESNKTYKIHPMVLGFLYQHENTLSMEEDIKPFASPRSWYYVSEWLKIFELLYGTTTNWNDDILIDLINVIEGTIGSVVAQDFITFIKYTYDINIDEIVKDPKRILQIKDKEKRIAVYYTVLTQLGLPKYRKYIIRYIDFSYYILGNNGQSKHFAMVALSIVSSFIRLFTLNDRKEFMKYEPPYDNRGYEDFHKIIDDLLTLLEAE